ncbi:MULTISPECIES: DUF2802 domain-containing protein [unclassified Motilimonas]|uniref:DUF2802 domain-containing protein n=1 Tax=Motilimonas TaxID=1914248 RepID=UPI001E35298E|nr:MULTISPECIES: DUF2802 domain-containing protein [unclassified Motilimonas]MCE0556263.1 DUF2802 domain-containing protein [Motilimonas sp. E26]MDO6525003.1 DUF2802 domain-containing protein [Motilimonas sp. 1_MG-2023]
MLDPLIQTSLIGLALLLAIISLVFSALVQKKQAKKIQALQQLTKELLKSKESLNKQIRELHSGSIGLGKKFHQLNEGLKEAVEKQQEIVDTAPDNKLYTRAVKMVALGAGLEELMNECELPKAEAELLLSLHGKSR